MSKRKILAFTPIFYPHMGGAERTVYELYTRLVRIYGYEIHLVTINTENAPSYELIEGIHVYRISKLYKNKFIKIICLQFSFLWLYIKNFINKGFKVLHVHYAFHLSPIVFVYKYIFRKKVIVSEYHFGTGADISTQEENPSYINNICGFVYNAADCILTISQDNKRFITSVSHKKNIHVIKQGTDHVFFAPEHCSRENKNRLRQNKSFVLVTTSRISPRKNIEDMISVVDILKKNGLDVLLLINGKVDKGNDEYFVLLQEKLKECNLEGSVVFNGFVSDESLREIYACADLFVLTSKYEGFGIANVEALASGTPVVTYDTGAAKDFISDGQNGYVTQNTPQDMAKIIQKVLENKEKLEYMSLQARYSVEKELNWDTYAKNNHDIIDKLFKS
ncbi:glycosyltransferase family 4 protein [Patescibacteria group bacterium]|nr:glycosyltransferase family 4 protein [Patescibacteria group bacterium]